MTTLWRTIRPNKEDRVAKLEWAANGGLGRVVIGKVGHSLSAHGSHTHLFYVLQNTLPMSDLVRPDPRTYVRSSTRISCGQILIIPHRVRAFSTAPMVFNIGGGPVPLPLMSS